MKYYILYLITIVLLFTIVKLIIMYVGVSHQEKISHYTLSEHMIL